MSKQCQKCGGTNVKIWDSRTPLSKDHPCRNDIVCMRRYKCRDCTQNYSTVEISRDEFDVMERAIADAHVGSQNMNGLLDAAEAINRLIQSERARLSEAGI